MIKGTNGFEIQVCYSHNTREIELEVWKPKEMIAELIINLSKEQAKELIKSIRSFTDF